MWFLYTLFSGVYNDNNIINEKKVKIKVKLEEHINYYSCLFSCKI